MKKNLKFLCSGILAMSGLFSFQQEANAQATPQRYYLASNNGSNLSTFNSASHVTSQYLYLPSDFDSALVAGIINTIYVRASSNTTNSTFTNFLVKIGTTNLTALPSGAWSNAGTLDTVLFQASYTFPVVTASQWLPITLDKGFSYDGTSNIVVELTQTGYTNGFATSWHNPGGTPAARMKYGGAAGPYYLNDFPPIFFGFDYCPDASINLGSDTVICEGSTITLDATLTGSTYLWNNSATDSVINVNAAGTYFVTATNGSCIYTDTITVSTSPLVSAEGIEARMQTAGKYDFSVINPQNALSYEWNFGDGNTATGATVTHQYASTGTYNASCRVINDCGSTTLTLNVNAVLSVHNISPSEMGIKVHPNPTKDIIHLEVSKTNQYSVELINITGRVLGSYENAKQIDLSTQAKGMYLLNITDHKTQNVSTVKVTKN